MFGGGLFSRKRRRTRNGRRKSRRGGHNTVGSKSFTYHNPGYNTYKKAMQAKSIGTSSYKRAVNAKNDLVKSGGRRGKSRRRRAGHPKHYRRQIYNKITSDK
jgi:hypothetical protein